MGDYKTLAGIFNDMPVETKSVSEAEPAKKIAVREAAKKISQALGDAVNPYGATLNENELTEYGKVVLDAFYEVWVLYNASLHDKWEWDLRNEAVYRFSLVEAEKYPGDAVKSNILFYELAKTVHEQMHRTLQSNLMRLLAGYEQKQGRCAEYTFPWI